MGLAISKAANDDGSRETRLSAAPSSLDLSDWWYWQGGDALAVRALINDNPIRHIDFADGTPPTAVIKSAADILTADAADLIERRKAARDKLRDKVEAFLDRKYSSTEIQAIQMFASSRETTTLKDQARDVGDWHFEVLRLRELSITAINQSQDPAQVVADFDFASVIASDPKFSVRDILNGTT